MDQAFGVSGLIFGYSLCRLISHPRYNFKTKIAKLSFKFIEILPNLRIKLRKRILHIHHWIFLAISFIVLSWLTSSFTQLILLKSFCLGGILQGIAYQDRFRIIIKQNIL